MPHVPDKEGGDIELETHQRGGGDDSVTEQRHKTRPVYPVQGEGEDIQFETDNIRATFRQLVLDTGNHGDGLHERLGIDDDEPLAGEQILADISILRGTDDFHNNLQ